MFRLNNYRTFLLSSLLLIGLIVGCKQQNQQPKTPEANGQQLEEKLWEEMANSNIPWLREHIADDFQSVHTDGARDATGELELISGLNLDEYILDNFSITQSGSQVIVTYTVSVPETIDGERSNAKPAPRLSVWNWDRSADMWKWSAHANLKTL